MTEVGPGVERPLRVLHLIGSAVDDFHADLSRLYAGDCLRSTADPAHRVDHVAWVEPGGTWRFPADLSREALAGAPVLTLAQALVRLEELAPDVVVPQMFCRPGMTTYRALVELLGLPMVGNPAEVMALATDKARTRAVVAAAGVAVPDGEVLRPGERPTLSPPVVVKPVDADNSDGVSLVRSEAELAGALEAAFRLGREVLVEAYVPLGREVRCGVLERGEELVCLPLEEYAVDEVTKPVRLADDKLRRDPDGELALVAKSVAHAWIVDPADPVVAGVHAAARAAHRALGCRDYSLFDFRIDPDGGVWFLEAGLYCSFARQSVVPTMAEAAGIALRDLFRAALAGAAGRGRGTVPPEWGASARRSPAMGTSDFDLTLQALGAARRNGPESAYRTAYDLLAQRSPAEALEVIEPALEQDPRNTGLRSLRAWAFMMRAQLHKAEAELRGLVEDTPDDLWSRHALGRVLERQSRFQEALPHLRLAAVMSGDLEREVDALRVERLIMTSREND